MASQDTLVELRNVVDVVPKLETDRESAGADLSEEVDLVDWDGPDDPQNPMNWPKSKKRGHVALVSIVNFLVNLSTTISAPGAGLLMKDFHQTNAIIGSFSISIFLLGFALGPLVMAPLSELYGRLPVYHLSIITFIAFLLGCGWSQNIVEFLIFRFIAGCAGSSPSTIGGGTVADLIPVEHRGAAIAMTSIGPIFAPVIGPVIGGFIAQRLGWRWTFWIVAAAVRVWLAAAMTFMRETCGPVILERKAARLRKETGNIDLEAKGRGKLSPLAHLGRGLSLPLKLLVLSPVVLLLSLYVAFIFGLMFLCFSTYSAVFVDQYHFAVGVSGLVYLGQGIGMITGLILFATLSDRILKARASKHKGEMTPEERLPLMVYFSPIVPIGFFWYGWTAQEKVQWMAPIVGTSFIGLGNLFVMVRTPLTRNLPSQIYLVDAFKAEAAASALAAATVLRSLFGTFLPLAAPHLYAKLGYGWGNSIFGFIALAFIPVPIMFYKFGARLRERFQVRL
ncbi:putative MFS transporter [Mollisia scopiformis]|uniref:Putative MFS transporter n=1 Tax=Mollisia scopiformis TaxID=149040 RepID=A0A132B446_MOLSC|nr:putative MFS transporter [Mollisia scopiformis]KUJ07188.1 putative MFS transporter [Mollisia scopiformis]